MGKSEEIARLEGVLLGLKICKEMWAQGTISHENIYENEVYYKELLEIEKVSDDSHSSDPVIDTLCEGDWFRGTEEQVSQAMDIQGGSSKSYKEFCVRKKSVHFISGQIVHWPPCAKTQLTPEEFLRRAENTFNNQK